MKSLFTKFRISAALDSGKRLPKSLQQKIAGDSDLKNFASQSRIFSKPRPEAQADPSLHESVMRAVRASARREQPRHAPVLSWVAASAVGAALVTVILLTDRAHPIPQASSSLDEPLAVLQMGEDMPKTVPSAVMAPLSKEWAWVNHDVEDTKQILLSSFPF